MRVRSTIGYLSNSWASFLLLISLELVQL